MAKYVIFLSFMSILSLNIKKKIIIIIIKKKIKRKQDQKVKVL